MQTPPSPSSRPPPSHIGCAGRKSPPACHRRRGAPVARSPWLPLVIVVLAGGLSPAHALDVPTVIRDFSQSHPDFDYRVGNDLGIVAEGLGTDGKPVYAGNPTTPTTHGAEFFDQWYRDVPGVNLRFDIMLPLEPNAEGLLVYENSAFFPIDGQGFGNEGNNRNFYFTTEMHLYFTYSGGEVLQFTGDDDLFVFMNGRLALNLGGVHPPQSGEVRLDDIAAAFGLQVGGTYTMDLFHAERHVVDSNFRLTTSIDLKVDPGDVVISPPMPPPEEESPEGESPEPTAEENDDDTTGEEPPDDGALDDGFEPFPDADGDGLPDGCRYDAEAGVQCDGDTGLSDLDDDGLPDVVDADRDGDGIPDDEDDDLDGDGIVNEEDDDLDGDGVPNGQDRDIDGDGTPNAQDLDVDGDGIRNESDGDIDGDGVPNAEDDDLDGDGVANDEDDDIDGDGRPNRTDASPEGVRGLTEAPATGPSIDDTGEGCGCRAGTTPGAFGIWLGLVGGLAALRRRCGGGGRRRG